MNSRMQRYADNTIKKISSRTTRNKVLYDNFANDNLYHHLSQADVPTKVVDLNELKNEIKTREEYQSSKELPNFSYPSKRYEIPVEEENNKIYDINQVLSQAKEKREEPDFLEKKRLLEFEENNVFKNKQLKEDIINYKKNAKEELEELINTISLNSKSLKEECDAKDLMNDLLPEEKDETVMSATLSKTILDKSLATIPKQEIKESQIDRTFYTRSMDLTDTDFNEKETDELFEKQNPLIMFLKVMLAILIVIAVGVFLYSFGKV